MKTPVFDIGDTLIPCKRLQEELFEDLSEKRIDIPDNLSIYKTKDVGEFLQENGIEADPENVIDKYKDMEETALEKNGIFDTLRDVGADIRKPGFISDNTLEGKQWFSSLLEKRDIPYLEITVSEEVGVEKPDPSIFERFLDETSLEGEECVYYGNNLNRDLSCTKVGMDFVHVRKFHVIGETDRKVETVQNLNKNTVRRFL